MGKLPEYRRMDKTQITADGIREYLMARANAHAKSHRTSWSSMSRRALSDDRFLARANAGSNFTIETYQRFIDWLDAQEAASASDRIAS